MKVQLEIIPVWDAMKRGGGCLLCDLNKGAQQKAVKFYLGPSVMNPETRVKVNKAWFCDEHLGMLLASGKVHGMALMAQTRLDAVKEGLEDSFRRLEKASSGWSLSKASKSLDEAMEGLEPHCLICESLKKSEESYAGTVAYLYEHDEDFRKALASSQGFCLPHFRLLVAMAGEMLKGKIRSDFVRELVRLEREHIDTLASDVDWQTAMFKSENFGKDWKGTQDAHRRVIAFLDGQKS